MDGLTKEYQDFVRQQNALRQKAYEEAQQKARLAFNQGLWESLPWYDKWCFPFLMEKKHE